MIFRYYITIADADIGNQKSLHTLCDKCLDHMLVKLDKIVWSEISKIVSFFVKKKPKKIHFWPSVDAILKDVSATETIALC